MKQPIVMPATFPVTCHTNHVGVGTTFVAICGYAENGVAYIREAIEKGAHSIVINKNVVFDNALHNYVVDHHVTVVRCDDPRQALADLSAQAAGYPAQKLHIIGITGTKGKTTTSFLLAHILRTAHYKVALISSAGNTIDGVTFSAPLTTPQPDYLHQFLKLCVERGVTHVVMEVAAQALTLHRVKGIAFDGIIFTNFSHEHLEFYATLDDYFAAKCSIFEMAKKNAPVLINGDDEYAQNVSQLLHNKNVMRYSYMQSPYECATLFGRYNDYNIVAATSMAHTLGVSNEWFATAIKTFPGVPGRLQRTQLPNGSCAYIDYAHNPSSFTAVLSTLRQLTDHLIVVFGAGGGKDKFKRPIMGNLASQYADFVVLTSDNPRLEHLEDIIADIQVGIHVEHQHKVTVVLDRKAAIEHAYAQSRNGSIIAILGKGPDEYQIIGKEKHFFSEQNILQQLS